MRKGKFLTLSSGVECKRITFCASVQEMPISNKFTNKQIDFLTLIDLNLCKFTA